MSRSFDVSQQISQQIREQADGLDLSRAGMKRTEQVDLENVRFANVLEGKKPVERDEVPLDAAVETHRRLKADAARHDARLGGAVAQHRGRSGQIMSVVEEKAPDAVEDVGAEIIG